MLLIVFASLLLFSTAEAQIYKWTDSKGKVHFGDQLPASERAENFDLNVTPPSSDSTTNQHSNDKNNSSKQSAIPKRIIMYGTSWCPYCKKARAYFKAKGIAYVEYDVEKLPSRMREFKNLGGTGYPLLLIGDNQKMQGFSEAGFERRYNAR